VSRIFSVFLGILTAIGGFVDIGDLVANALVGARFGLSLAWATIVGPASMRPSPAGGPMAPASAISWATMLASSRLSPRPCHSSGHVGHAQPESTRISRHSRIGRSGSQLASSHVRTSLRTACSVGIRAR
jgi:hypothetical protein